MEVTLEDKRQLLSIARESIIAAFKSTPLSSRPRAGSVTDQPCGAFVTLRIHSDLRGCIGYIEPRVALYKTVEEVAQKAAFEDPRFPPLTEEELLDLEIEISVLSPLQKISSVSEIEVGKHGLVIDAGYTRGLLLPQVATEYGWSREEFLTHTARKAGLPPDAWKTRGVELFVFTSEVFSESEVQPLHT
jgi:AmmeMemoRadiSam system protein A